MYVTTCCCKLVDAGWYPSTTFWPMPVSNPYGVEGYKTIAFEIVEQLGRDAAARAHVFVPVGGGDSLYGIYKGFHEQVALGVLGACRACTRASRPAPRRSSPPRPAAPTTFRTSRSIARWHSRSVKRTRPATRCADCATALASRWPVRDGEIMDAASRLGRLGLSVDPASAASVAGALAWSAAVDWLTTAPWSAS